MLEAGRSLRYDCPDRFAGLEYPLDVAVIDLGLPKLTGLEVIRRPGCRGGEQ